MVAGDTKKVLAICSSVSNLQLLTEPRRYEPSFCGRPLGKGSAEISWPSGAECCGECTCWVISASLSLDIRRAADAMRFEQKQQLFLVLATKSSGVESRNARI